MLSGAPVIGKPRWVATPTTEDLQAAMAGLPSGLGDIRVVLTCTVRQGRWMDRCAIESEAPAGKGYGDAALKVAAKARIVTWTNEGLPVVGGIIRVPIRFQTGAPAPVKAP
jgi:protein TonB